MISSKQFLKAEEIRKRIIVCAFDVSPIGPTVGNISTESPSFFIEATVECIHPSQRIVAVCSTQGKTVAYALIPRTEIVIVGTSQTGNTKTTRLERQCKINVSRQLVQASNRGVTESTALHIIDWSSINVNLIVLLI